MRYLFFSLIFVLLASSGWCWSSNQYQNKNSFLKPNHQNQYGPGVHSDATGRTFQWKTRQGQVLQGFEEVQPDAYGPDIGMDPYGRPVIPTSPQNDVFDNNIFDSW